MSQSIVLEDMLLMEVEWSWRKSILKKLYRHVHEANTVREVRVVCDFSWLAENVINKLGQGTR